MNASKNDDILYNGEDPKIKEKETHLQRLWWLEMDERACLFNRDPGIRLRDVGGSSGHEGDGAAVAGGSIHNEPLKKKYHL